MMACHQRCHLILPEQLENKTLTLDHFESTIADIFIQLPYSIEVRQIAVSSIRTE